MDLNYYRELKNPALLDAYLDLLHRQKQLREELASVEVAESNARAVITERMHYTGGPNALDCQSLSWRGYTLVVTMDAGLNVYQPKTINPA